MYDAGEDDSKRIGNRHKACEDVELLNCCPIDVPSLGRYRCPEGEASHKVSKIATSLSFVTSTHMNKVTKILWSSLNLRLCRSVS
jgi:hypothetical protein